MTLVELLDGFHILMRTPGFPQLLGLFSVVCVFLGAVLFESNGHKILVLVIIATILVVGEEVLRAVYLESIFGVFRPNPIALAILAYITMIVSVVLGYAAKSVVKRTEVNQEEVGKEIADMLVRLDIQADKEAVEETSEEVVQDSPLIEPK